MIDSATGIRLKPTACREFLKKIGMKYRRCGLMPGKANDENQQQIQQEFHDQQLQPLLKEAEQGNRIILFVDAVHFVMGAFLGLLWCFTRLLLPSACGRQRYNLLAAYNPFTYDILTITNETYINQQVFCLRLEKIALFYANTDQTITLVLDNARYQKSRMVAEKADKLKIELLYLPPYSPNLNLIERLWRFIKQQVLYSQYYEKFENFKHSIDSCVVMLNTTFKSKIQSLMTLRFQLFSQKTEILSV
jgi:transposase